MNRRVKSRNLRAYLEALQRTAHERGLAVEAGSDVHRWLEWARQHADQLDPLQEELPPKSPPPEPPRNPWDVPWGR